MSEHIRTDSETTIFATELFDLNLLEEYGIRVNRPQKGGCAYTIEENSKLEDSNPTHLTPKKMREYTYLHLLNLEKPKPKQKRKPKWKDKKYYTSEEQGGASLKLPTDFKMWIRQIRHLRDAEQAASL